MPIFIMLYHFPDIVPQNSDQKFQRKRQNSTNIGMQKVEKKFIKIICFNFTAEWTHTDEGTTYTKSDKSNGKR